MIPLLEKQGFEYWNLGHWNFDPEMLVSGFKPMSSVAVMLIDFWWLAILLIIYVLRIYFSEINKGSSNVEKIFICFSIIMLCVNSTFSKPALIAILSITYFINLKRNRGNFETNKN